jgi:hypothetical protein
MKVFAFILSAYLVFLVAIPCCTLDNCSEYKSVLETNHEKNDGSAPADRDCGSCSPFFTCTGCFGFTVSIESNNFEIISYISGHSYTGYILTRIPDAHFDFWQPPKLV